MICFIHSDETYRQMAHRDLLEGTFPKKKMKLQRTDLYLAILVFQGS